MNKLIFSPVLLAVTTLRKKENCGTNMYHLEKLGREMFVCFMFNWKKHLGWKYQYILKCDIEKKVLFFNPFNWYPALKED